VKNNLHKEGKYHNLQLHQRGKPMLDLTAAFATFPVLETERFLLRAVTRDDVADIFRVMSDPRVTRYFGVLPMAALDQAQQRVQAIQTAFREQTGVRWASLSFE
jgi:RimJ/RimL family protein N-acetyltransferase